MRKLCPWLVIETGGTPRAPKRTKRSPDPDRPGNRLRQAVPQLLAARAPGGGVTGERLSAGAGEALVRAAAGISRQRRPAWPDRRVLRPSRRVAVVRPQRGKGSALPLSWLEIRRDGPVHRRALGT